ncbi:VanZ family protein [Polynucleobacter victoriensis]|uniref:VanZ like family protein n=1 Tax=Polynucleobacter victoriensis TaxID=2049319 RepID=A0A212T8Y0_9BURK|nr:VanZ family protein [Polynucleobacter victoriensis]SNC62254.1 VanZ like family protein [Polynucleobacter victoriensis]
MLLMTTLFLVPQEFVSSDIFDWWDKAQHALAFGLLMLLGFVVYAKYFWRMMMSLILYGAVIEIIQSWTGWRQGDVMDALADMVGVLVIALPIRGYQNYSLRSGR